MVLRAVGINSQMPWATHIFISMTQLILSRTSCILKFLCLIQTPPTSVIILALTIFTCCFLLVMGGSLGLKSQALVDLIHRGSGVPEKLGLAWSDMSLKQPRCLEAILVGVWYLTSLNSSSISWGAGLNGELKTPGDWKRRDRERG